MKQSYIIENLDCAHCAALMESEIRKVDGVRSASVVFMTQKLILEVEDDRSSEVFETVAKICKRIEPECRILW